MARATAAEPFALGCDLCGRENPQDAMFCNRCGARLAPTIADVHADGERRPVTVLFADLVESVALAQELDAEDWRDIVLAYNQRCRDAIAGHGGVVVQYLGDGVMAYFGFPSASEEDAERAVRAALDIVDAVRAMAAEVCRQHGVELAVRAGVHCGPVVVGRTGDGERPEPNAVGDTLNIAARLQASAAPGTVVTSDACRLLIEGQFELTDLGPVDLKGVRQPLRCWRVGPPIAGSHRLDSVGVTLSPLVGRSRELALLATAWSEAQHGRGSSVIVRGEPGVGKSRLGRELRQHVAELGGQVMVCRCRPTDQGTPFGAVIEMFRRLARGGADTAGRRGLALGGAGDAGLEQLDLDIVAALMGLGDVAWPSMPAADRRARTLTALVRCHLGWASAQPSLLLVEDLHWSDPSTLEFVRRLAQRVHTAPLLLVITARPDIAWTEVDQVLSLAPLGADDARTLVRSASEGPLDPAVMQRIIDRSDGLPLFLEELARTAARLDAEPEAVPTTLLGLLAARLDRLGPVKAVAQAASIVGRDVPVPLLARALAVDAEDARADLDVLVDAGIMRPRGDEEYTFSHALVRDASYQSLLRPRRRELHHRLAVTLAADDLRTRRPEVIAQHFDAADEPGRAIEFWRDSIQIALHQHALEEAMMYLDRALACLVRIPACPERSALELQLRVSEVMILTVKLAPSDPRVTVAVEQALALCEREGSELQRFTILTLLTSNLTTRGFFEAAARQGEALLATAHGMGHPMLVTMASMITANTLLMMGRFEDVIARVDAALRLPDVPLPAGDDALDPGVLLRATRAHALAAVGLGDDGRRSADDAVHRARCLDPADPYSLGWALLFRGWLALIDDDIGSCADDALELTQIGAKGGYGALHAFGLMLEACVTILRGEVDEGVAAFEAGRAMQPDWSGFGYLVTVLARGYAATRSREEALEMLQAARADRSSRGEHYCEEDFLRVAGEIAFDGSQVERAEACLRDALACAVEHGSHAGALRAATSLARVVAAGGRMREARSLLEPLVGACRQSRDGPRFQHASRLLAELR